MKKLTCLNLTKLHANELDESKKAKLLGGSCTDYSCQCSGSWSTTTYNGGSVSGDQVVNVTLDNRSSAGQF